MAIIEINKNPNRKDLLVFGFLLGLFTILLGLLAHFQWQASAAARMIWLVGAGLTVLYFAVPPLRRPLFLGWIYATFPIGWTISHLLMAIIYYGVLTPIGLVLRLCGKDPIEKDIDSGRSSYWVEHPTKTDAGRYFRQF